MYLDEVACSGSEANLTECIRNHIGVVSSNCRSHSEDASVYCGSKHCTLLISVVVNVMLITYNSRVS